MKKIIKALALCTLLWCSTAANAAAGNDASPQSYFLTPPSEGQQAITPQPSTYSSTTDTSTYTTPESQTGVLRGMQTTPIYSPMSTHSSAQPSTSGTQLQEQQWIPPEKNYSNNYFQSWMKDKGSPTPQFSHDQNCCDPACPPDVPMNDCYCLYCHYRPCYYYTTECEYVPNYEYQKCCRYVPQYYKETRCRNCPENYSVTRCRSVPEHYTVTKCRYIEQWNEETCCCEPCPVYYQEDCCRQVPQYYEEICTRMVPQYYEETCCRYVPEYYYICVCNYCPQYKYKRNCTYIPQYYYKHTGCADGSMVMQDCCN